MIGAERELIAALRYCAESKIGRFYGFAQNEYEMAKKEQAQRRKCVEKKKLKNAKKRLPKHN